LAVSVYADASLLVALLAPDVFNGRARRYLSDHRPTLLISDFAAAEFASVIAKRVRTRDMSPADAALAFSAFDAWSARLGARLELARADMARAEALIRRLDLSLRTPDALNIAMAERHGASLATFDRGMATAATAVGLALAPA
jgi:predicted nucleic acid-binding protein